MGELSVEVRSSATEAPFPAPPPPRRPRVREVSSRFMSPVASSSSGDLHLLASRSPCPSRQQHQQQPRSTSAHRRRQTETEPSNCADENIRNPPETPLGIQCKTTAQGKSRAVAKLFKENNGARSEQQQQNPDSWRSRTYGDGGKLSVRNGYAFTPSRPDTPTVTDRMASPRSRYMQRSISGPPTATAAAKLLQQSSGGMSMSMSLPAQSSNQGSSKANGHMGSAPVNLGDGSDENSVQNSLAKSLADLRSSMPEADMLPTMSNRFLTERNGNNRSGNAGVGGDSFRFTPSPCARSLNMPLSGCDVFSSVRGTEKSASVLNKSCSNPMKMGGVCLPPVPPYAKAVAEARKVKKVSGQQEDVHSLKLLHNHYLQWRFANAKAAASMQVQKREVERTLVSLRVKMTDMCESVKRKRIELGILQRTKSLSTIVEAQMPYLEEWSALEEDYLISLSEVIQALVNASLQLPISGGVRADTREVGEALSSAVKMMEMITLNAQSFMPKAEGMERSVSELARLVGGEKALVEECGDMLVKTHMAQVEECCIRSQLMQLQRIEQP